MDEDAQAPAQREMTPQPLTRGVPFLWALVALAIAGLTSAAAYSLLRADRGPRPAFVDAPEASAHPPATPIPARSREVVLAGSGSNLPLTRALAIAFLDRHPGVRVVVPESIGSTGGVRALHDGAIDVALVSRPLSEQEEKLGFTVTPYARVPVVVAANPSVLEACVASGGLAGMWAGQGEHARWSDTTPVVVLQRERGDSSFVAVSRALPALAAANDAAYREKRWRVLYDDRSMQEALMATEGAVGVFDLGEIVAQRLPIKVLCVDGVTPSVEAVLAGRYPYFKDLAFVTLGPIEGLRREVLDFVVSPEGRALTASLGYAPLPLSANDAAPSGGGAP